MHLHLVQDQESFIRLKADQANSLKELSQLEQKLTDSLGSKQKIFYNGYSWPIQRKGKFILDRKYTDTDQINFRERLVCQKTKFNNRIRAAIHIFEDQYQPKLNDPIYITEQHTLLYKWLRKKYVNTIGSEYMSESSWLNKLRFRLKLFPDTLNHQDLTQLSYVDEKFKYVLSFDCFEHIPNYQKGLQEIYRSLKQNGILLFSVPFDVQAKSTLVRASIDSSGKIQFHEQPEYHGNPVSKKGSLSYYTFGWDLLKSLRAIGFKEVSAIVYWSKKYAYLGSEQLLISAKK